EVPLISRAMLRTPTRRQVQPRQAGLTPERLQQPRARLQKQDVSLPANAVRRRTSGRGHGKRHWRLENVPEKRVLKAGLLRLQQLLGSSSGLWDEDAAEPSASSPKRVLRRSFFERILDGQLELKACPPSDVLAAQGDLRHLSVRQLLAIRTRELDFPVTQAGSFNVHSNFLAALDNELFDKIGRRALRGQAPPELRTLKALGLRMVLCLGSADLVMAVEASADSLKQAPPPLWLSPLDEEDWPGCSFLLAHTGELWAQALPGLTPDLVSLTAGSDVSVVMDLVSGARSDRLLHWEVTCIDPRKDDVAGALALARARRRCTAVALAKPVHVATVADLLENAAGELRAADFASESLLDSPKLPLACRQSEEYPKKASWPPAKEEPDKEQEPEGVAVDWPSPSPRKGQRVPEFGTGPGSDNEPSEPSFFEKLFAQVACCGSNSRRADHQNFF
ncbi:unnamed protein product, partial [Polarella glacialis]